MLKLTKNCVLVSVSMTRFFTDGFCPSYFLTEHMETPILDIVLSDFYNLTYGKHRTVNCKNRITLYIVYINAKFSRHINLF